MWRVYVYLLGASNTAPLVALRAVCWELFGSVLSWIHEHDLLIFWCLYAILVLWIFLSRYGFPNVQQRVRTAARFLLALLPQTTLPLLIAACLFVVSCMYWNEWYTNGQTLEDAFADGEVELELLDDSAERDYGIVSVAQATLDGKKIQCRILWPDDTEILKAGSLVIVSGSLTLASDSDGGRWNHQNAYVGMVSASSVEDAGYANSLRGQMAPFRNQAFERLSSLEEEIAAILTGVVIADKTLYKGTVLEQNFQTTGLAHLMAVSGTHLAVVVMLLMLLLGILPIPRWARTLILAFF